MTTNKGPIARSLYSSLFEDYFLSAYYRLRGRHYGRYRRLLEQSQWWPVEQVQAFQWRELRRLLEHAFHEVPYYQGKYREAGACLEDIRSLDDFAKLPPLTREEINNHRDELKSSNLVGGYYPHATGGSSGVPTRFYVSMDSYTWRSAATSRAYSWSGLRMGERTLYLWGAPVGHVPLLQGWKTNLFRAARRELIVNTFLQTERLWEETLSKARAFNPSYIVGYVSSIEAFANYLLDRKIELPGIRGVISAAEAVFDTSRDLVRRAFNAPLFNAYGSREFMSLAAECEAHDGLHINSENIVVEAEYPDEHNPSELLVTDLHNYATPFLRYRIGDLGILKASAECSCGRGLHKVAAIEGRVGERLRTIDGRIVSALWFPHVVKEFPEIREFQVQQKTVGELTLRILLDRPLALDHEQRIKLEFAKQFGKATCLTVQVVKDLPRPSSGKRRIAIGLPQ